MRVLVAAIAAICLSFTVAHADDNGETAYTIKRAFVDGAYGQVHLRIARPRQEPTHPPLVLFHASPYSGDYFLPFIREMARDRIVIAMDTPGYGDSDPPPAPPAISGYAASAQKALRELDKSVLGGNAVDVLGYHTGALIAAELALLEPSRIRRLVLPGVPYLIGGARKDAYEEYVQSTPLSADGAHLADKWAFATYAMPVGVTLQRAQEHFGDMMQCEPRCWWSYHGVFSYESDQRFPMLSQPVLLISYDGSLSDETKSAAAVIPDARHVHIDGVTRGAFDVAADKLAAETRTFLDRPDE